MLCASLHVGRTQPHALHCEPTRDTHAPRTPAAEHSLASQEPQYAGTMSFTASATTLHPITAPLRMPSASVIPALGAGSMSQQWHYIEQTITCSRCK